MKLAQILARKVCFALLRFPAFSIFPSLCCGWPPLADVRRSNGTTEENMR